MPVGLYGTEEGMELKASFVQVDPTIEQRKYFSFYPYEYRLAIEKQQMLMPVTMPLKIGLQESFEWYLANMEKVRKKPFMEYIDENCLRFATTGCADSSPG